MKHRALLILVVVALLAPSLLAAQNAAPAGEGKAPAKPAPAAPAAPVADDALPSAEEIRKLFEKGEYNETLRALARVLPLKGKAAVGYDRHALLLLKAETHVQLKRSAAAVQALQDAADAAEDPTAAAEARATALLFKRSKQFVFTPRPPKRGKLPAPIDVSDPANRKAALEAMLEEELSKVMPKVDNAAAGRTLPPIGAAMTQVQEIRYLELAATGSDGKTAALVNQLGERGNSLMSKGLEKMSKRVDEITALANETRVIRKPARTARGGTVVREEVHRRGLKGNEAKELKQVIEACPPIAKTAQELAVAMGGRKADAQALVDRAADLHERATRTLNDRYATE